MTGDLNQYSGVPVELPPGELDVLLALRISNSMSDLLRGILIETNTRNDLKVFASSLHQAALRAARSAGTGTHEAEELFTLSREREALATALEEIKEVYLSKEDASEQQMRHALGSEIPTLVDDAFYALDPGEGWANTLEEGLPF